MNIRVLTLNVWNTEGDPRRTELINRELRRLNPDLVSLQEVANTPDGAQLPKLLDGLNFHSIHQSDVQPYTPPFADRYGGSAIATRWPHKFIEALDLRIAGASDVPWSTLAVSVELPQLGELLFIGATAAWRSNAEWAREQQALAVADLDARHRRDLPTIIAGDFNAAPDAASIRFLTGRQSLAGRSVCYHDAWAIAGNGPGYTWTRENPNAEAGIEQIVRQPGQQRRIDYIFVGSWDAHPNAFARVENAALVGNSPVEGIWLSDHYGVVADLTIGKDN